MTVVLDVENWHSASRLAVATTTLVLVAFVIPLALLVRTVAADRAISARHQRGDVAGAVTDPGRGHGG